MTFVGAIDLFLENLKEKHRSPKTISHYKGCLLRFNNYLSEKYNRFVYINEVTHDDFERYLYETPNDKNFTQVTRSSISTAFKSLFSFCYMRGYCQHNIGKQLTPIKVKSKERGYITEEEMLKMVDILGNKVDKAIMQTMFYTGMRIGEVTNLTLEDINIRDNYIYVNSSKSSYDRKIPISMKLRMILEEYIEYYRNEQETDNDKVFIHDNGRNYSGGYFNKIIKLAAQKAGLNSKISSHIMRHSFASNLIAKGVDIARVKKLLGHESINTTHIYLHTNMQLLRNAVDTL
jgi:site-specific recombinase XerD